MIWVHSRLFSVRFYPVLTLFGAPSCPTLSLSGIPVLPILVMWRTGDRNQKGKDSGVFWTQEYIVGPLHSSTEPQYTIVDFAVSYTLRMALIIMKRCICLHQTVTIWSSVSTPFQPDADLLALPCKSQPQKLYIPKQKVVTNQSGQRCTWSDGV